MNLNTMKLVESDTTYQIVKEIVQQPVVPTLVEGSDLFGFDQIIVWLCVGIGAVVLAYFRYILHDYKTRLNGLHKSVNEKIKKNHEEIDSLDAKLRDVEKKQASAVTKIEAQEGTLKTIQETLKGLGEKIDRLIERK